MNSRRQLAILIVSIVALRSFASAEAITVATYNIENFKNHFLARHIAATKPSPLPRGVPEVAELMREMRNANDEDCWEISQVILDGRFNPDVMVIEECCNQQDLDYFNHRWLGDSYATVIVFPGNSERGQMLALMAK